MTHEQRTQASRLFTTLEYGEQLAHQCALHQAESTECAQSRCFLRTQARQEAFHADLFRKAADWLTPQRRYQPPVTLTAFGGRLARAMNNRDSTECLVASQIVLEGFGEQILQRLNRGLDNHNIGFKRQRYLVLQQEQSHYAFGLNTLRKKLELNETTHHTVHSRVGFYLQMVNQIIDEMGDIFVALDEDAVNYKDSLIQALPTWLYEGSL
jgi:hypothetical protein